MLTLKFHSYIIEVIEYENDSVFWFFSEWLPKVIQDHYKQPLTWKILMADLRDAAEKEKKNNPNKKSG